MNGFAWKEIWKASEAEEQSIRSRDDPDYDQDMEGLKTSTSSLSRFRAEKGDWEPSQLQPSESLW